MILNEFFFLDHDLGPGTDILKSTLGALGPVLEDRDPDHVAGK